MTAVPRVLTLAFGLLQPIQTVGLVQETRIGAVDGPGALTNIVDVAVGRDGRVFVAQWNVGEIAVFGSDGRFERFIGRSGSGPGEFRSPSRLGWSGDTLWVADPPQARISYFHGTELVRETHVRSPPGVFLAAIGVLRDGSILSERGVRSSEVLRDGVSTTAIVRSSSEGQGGFDTVAVRSIGGLTRLPAANGRSVLLREPFAQGDLRSLAPDGETLVLVDDVPSADRYELRWVSAVTGDTLRRSSYTYAPVKPTQADVDRYLSDTSLRLDSVTRRNVARSLSLPDRLPPVTAIAVGAGGCVFLRRERMEGNFAEWLILDSRGVVMGSFRLPGGSVIRYGTATHIWAVEKDELDVPWIGRYRLEWPVPQMRGPPARCE